MQSKIIGTLCRGSVTFAQKGLWGHPAGAPKSIFRIGFAGAPAAIVPASISRLTTELAPTTQRSPTSTPLVTAQLTPNQQLEPISTGPFELNPCQVIGFSGSSKRCSAS